MKEDKNASINELNEMLSKQNAEKEAKRQQLINEGKAGHSFPLKYTLVLVDKEPEDLVKQIKKNELLRGEENELYFLENKPAFILFENRIYQYNGSIIDKKFGIINGKLCVINTDAEFIAVKDYYQKMQNNGQDMDLLNEVESIFPKDRVDGVATKPASSTDIYALEKIIYPVDTKALPVKPKSQLIINLQTFNLRANENKQTAKKNFHQKKKVETKEEKEKKEQKERKLYRIV